VQEAELADIARCFDDRQLPGGIAVTFDPHVEGAVDEDPQNVCGIALADQQLPSGDELFFGSCGEPFEDRSRRPAEEVEASEQFDAGCQRSDLAGDLSVGPDQHG